MDTTDKSDKVYAALESHGYKGKTVSFSHYDEVRSAIRTQYRKGLLDKTFYTGWLKRFEETFSADLSSVRSLIVVAVPQPNIRLTFQVGEMSYPVIIPPTYNNNTDKAVHAVLEEVLSSKGFCAEIISVPEKVLAVRSGLARYGRNNISYVNGMGSFHRLVAFVSDMPCLHDNWFAPGPLEECNGCTLCQKACPTGAIDPDRFLLHAERCITYFNEAKGGFPQWLKPSWHNCLVGCLYCQKVCPANQDVKNRYQEGPMFSTEETAALLRQLPIETLPSGIIRKIESIGFSKGYLDVLGRNLKILAGLSD